jgi:lipopolysaccharide transport system ATP-binding protein
MNSEASAQQAFPNAGPVLRVARLGKQFPFYENRWGRLLEIVSGRPQHRPHWVLRDVSFELHPGEALGLIGRNGAGKSTLLKILAGVQQPTTGSASSQGIVSAILELGLGFHPDFTGRQNARQAALLQGMTDAELQRAMPAIESFAELGEYFDQPVHTYSSGMQMRLAFSVATCRQPSVLIVDEALAVGDAYFQHKCYERIRHMRAQGAAIILVSHDPTSIRSLCSRAMLLSDGVVVQDGDPEFVLERYNALLAPDMSRQYEELARHAQGDARALGRRSGSGQVVFDSVELCQGGQPCMVLVSDEPAQVVLSYRVLHPVRDLTLGLSIRDRLGNDVFGTNTHYHSQALPTDPGVYRMVWDVAGFHLGAGNFSLTVAAHAGASHQSGSYDWWDRCVSFQVIPGTRPFSVGPTVLHLQPQSAERLSES